VVCCSDSYFPPEFEWCLAVDYFCSRCPSNCTNSPLCDTMLMLAVTSTELEYCTMCGQEHSELPIVEFSSAMIALNIRNAVLSAINFGLIAFVRGDEILSFFIGNGGYSGLSRIVIE
jgi:hypothetical protein